MKKTIILTWIILVLAIFLFSFSVYADQNDAIGLSISIVNQDPDPAFAGDIVELRFGIENLGGKKADNFFLEVLPEYPFSLLPGENAIQRIGTLEGFQGAYETKNVKTLKYKLLVDRNTPAGTYEFQIMYYENSSVSSVLFKKSFSIEVINRESAEVIHIDKTTLVPGKISPLKFSINNVGNAPLRDLTFNWENTDKVILPVGSDNTRYVKYIDIGQSAELQYNVIADTNAVAGLYKLDLYLTYNEAANNSVKQISTMAGVYVGGGTDFDIAFSENANGQTSFTVSNVGSNPASSVSVIIPEQRAWRVTGSNSVIIGNLNKGDYTVASFRLQSAVNLANMSQNRNFRGSALGNNTQERPFRASNATSSTPSSTAPASPDSLKIQIAYTDTMGERNVVEKEVKLSLQNIVTGDITGTGMQGRRQVQSQSFFSTYKWHIIGLIVLIVLVIVYNRYKKLKIHNPSMKIKDLLYIFRKITK